MATQTSPQANRAQARTNPPPAGAGMSQPVASASPPVAKNTAVAPPAVAAAPKAASSPATQPKSSVPAAAAKPAANNIQQHLAQQKELAAGGDLPPPATDEGGKKRIGLDIFEIKQLLGKGAFGEVYLVIHKVTSRKMALKQMDKKLIEVQGKQEHVKNEKRVLIKGRSDFLVKLHYSFQTKECLYLAMEYCPGGDLREFLEVLGSLEEEEATLWFAEMIMAVHTLHTLGYIHRDLKPDNFLIDSRGHLKLADFGLSKANKVKITIGAGDQHAAPGVAASFNARQERLSLMPGQAQQQIKEKLSKKNIDQRFRRTMLLKGGLGEVAQTAADMGADSPLAGMPANNSLTLTKRMLPPPQRVNLAPKPKISMRKQLAYSVVGSPDYMSPEVTSGLDEGGGIGYSEEVDWWSLGCVFFEVRLGVPPFTGDSPEEIFENIRNWRVIIPPLLEQYQEYMSPECHALLSGFLCEPKDRLGSDIKALQAHSFFSGKVEWEHLIDMESPFIPNSDM